MRNRLTPIILLIIISVFFVFYKFNSIPKGLAHDENELARVAFSLENKPYTSFTLVADGHGTPYFYILLSSFKMFGVNQFALRLPSRIFGILSILFFYLIFKLINKNQKKHYSLLFIIYSLVLLTSRWFLHFSRISLEMPFLLSLELISLYCIISFIENKKQRFLILSSIFAAIAFNSYQPGRIFIIVPLIILLIKKINFRLILIYLMIFLFLIFPMTFFIFTHPKSDIRIDQQFYLKNTEISLQTKFNYLSENIQKTTMMFFTKGDINGHHNYSGKPALNPIFALFFLSGFIISIIKIKDFNNIVFVLYFFVAMIPTILTYPWENPNMLRTYTALPSIVYFVSQSIIFLNSLFRKKRILLICVYLLLFLSIGYELRTYFKYQPLVFRQAFDKPDYLKIIRESQLRSK